MKAKPCLTASSDCSASRRNSAGCASMPSEFARGRSVALVACFVRVVPVMLGLLLVALAAASGVASAAVAPAPLWKVGENCGLSEKIGNGECGGGVGETDNPRGIGVDPALPGYVYVADSNNRRVDEFTAWGEFVKAWGWGVADGASELQVCGPGAVPPTAACRQALAGSGVGEFRFASPQGVAVDSGGDVYAVDWQNHRVQKFDSEGHFLLMFGGGVDQGPHNPGNVCTAASIAEGDACGAGSTGTGDGQFSAEWPFSSYIAVGPGDKIYVGDKGRIEEFDTNGVFTGKIEGGVLAGKRIQSLAVDGTGNPYVAFCSATCEGTTEPDVSKLNPVTGATVCTLTVGRPTAITTDPAGNVYVVDLSREELGEKGVEVESMVHEFGSDCVEKGVPFGGDELERVTGIATGGACLSQGVDLYVANLTPLNSFVRAYGSQPDAAVCPPPLRAPGIDGEYAVAVDPGGASLRAAINPHFWSGSLGVTNYYVQYGEGKCSEGGCSEEQPLAPGFTLNAGVVDADVTTPSVVLSGLKSHTLYHYRFVAQSSGGGPVFGVGGKVGTDGEEGTFTTSPTSIPGETDCPNQALRTGFSAGLPDCRAYEMVSPVDKSNGSVVELCGNSCSVLTGLDQSSLVGGKLTYTSYRAFGGAESSPFGVQYLASRGANGWSSQPVAPPSSRVPVERSLSSLEVPFKAFSSDLCDGWFVDKSEPPLDSAAPLGAINLYRRGYCGGAGYEALIRTERHTELPLELQGVSADGSNAVFHVADQLTPEAPPLDATSTSLYEASAGGSLRLVSVLPDGTPNKIDASVGTASYGGFSNGHEYAVAHALSADGSRVYWTTMVGSGSTVGPGLALYLRENAGEEQSEMVDGECVEPSKACTVSVSETVSGGGAVQFWTAAPDGSKAVFTVGGVGGVGSGDLYEYDAEEGASTLIAHKVEGVVGASEDVSRLYFASEEVLAAGATAGEPNLYLREAGGGFTFVATFSATDLARLTDTSAAVLSPLAARPNRHIAQVSHDGLHVVFMSSSRDLSELTAGYDNTDVSTGKPDGEVFLYDAPTNGGTGRLVCASCNPTGVRPVAGPFRLGAEDVNAFPVAAWISGWETELYDPRVLSVDGKRLFFNSFEALVPGDTNGAVDVYEWEAAGEGGCAEASAVFSARNGGCVRLISSGQNPAPSEFLDASNDGSEAFFKTDASLLPQDPGLIDIYDARINGGFPPPASPPAVCEGEACQGPPTPPNDATPASMIFGGPGDLLPTLTTTSVTTKQKIIASQVRAQKLSRALRACRTKAKAKRVKSCEAAARKRYGAKSSKKARKATRGGKQS